MDQNEKKVLLSIQNLDVVFKKGKKQFKAVDNVSFDIYKGETLSLVGESGSGKTTVGRAIVRINPCTAGAIYYDGKKISGKLSRKEDREVVRKLQMIFQDPSASLNERATIEYIISEGLYNFHLYKDEKERVSKIEEITKEVGLLPEHLTRYPHEFSGGQRQRVGIARALILNPVFLVCDEPVSALDVSVQAQIVNLLKQIQKERKLASIFISHDINVVRYISDRVVVMYLGHIVEEAPTDELIRNPKHPYTKSLLASVPNMNPRERKKHNALEGEIPSPMDPPSGCVFHTRCPYATEACSQAVPEYREVSDGHWVSCPYD